LPIPSTTIALPIRIMIGVTLRDQRRVVAHYLSTGEPDRYVVTRSCNPSGYDVIDGRKLPLDLKESYWGNESAVGHDMNRDGKALQKVFRNLKAHRVRLEIFWVAKPSPPPQRPCDGEAVQFYVPDTGYKLTTWCSSLKELLDGVCALKVNQNQSNIRPQRPNLSLKSELEIDTFVDKVQTIYPDPDVVGSYLGGNSWIDFTELTEPVKRVLLLRLLELLPDDAPKSNWNQEFEKANRVVKLQPLFNKIKGYTEQIINNGRAPLSRLSEAGDIKAIKSLLAGPTVHVNPVDENGRTPLSLAAEKGHEAVVQMLLDKQGVGLNSKDRLGMTPLAWAAVKGHQAVVKLLVDKEGVDLDPKTNRGMTPLSLAAQNGQGGVVQLLVDKEGVDVNSQDENCWTPLLWAAWKGCKTVVQLLVDKEGVDLNSRDRHRQTPLSCAIDAWHESVVKVLVDKESVDVNSIGVLGRTPLSCAARTGQDGLVKLLLDKGANPNTTDENGCTPLLEAVKMGHEAVVKLLQQRKG
jgi:ankyrin repeat protein